MARQAHFRWFEGIPETWSTCVVYHPLKSWQLTSNVILCWHNWCARIGSFHHISYVKEPDLPHSSWPADDFLHFYWQTNWSTWHRRGQALHEKYLLVNSHFGGPNVSPLFLAQGASGESLHLKRRSPRQLQKGLSHFHLLHFHGFWSWLASRRY